MGSLQQDFRRQVLSTGLLKISCDSHSGNGGDFLNRYNCHEHMIMGHRLQGTATTKASTIRTILASRTACPMIDISTTMYGDNLAVASNPICCSAPNCLRNVGQPFYLDIYGLHAFACLGFANKVNLHNEVCGFLFQMFTKAQLRAKQETTQLIHMRDYKRMDLVIKDVPISDVKHFFPTLFHPGKDAALWSDPVHASLGAEIVAAYTEGSFSVNDKVDLFLDLTITNPFSHLSSDSQVFSVDADYLGEPSMQTKYKHYANHLKSYRTEKDRKCLLIPIHFTVHGRPHVYADSLLRYVAGIIARKHTTESWHNRTMESFCHSKFDIRQFSKSKLINNFFILFHEALLRSIYPTIGYFSQRKKLDFISNPFNLKDQEDVTRTT